MCQNKKVKQMGVELSEQILEKSKVADKVQDIIFKCSALTQRQKLQMFWDIQPLLHQLIDSTVECVREREKNETSC